jgi:phosphatidate cytidylyltransferase
MLRTRVLTAVLLLAALCVLYAVSRDAFIVATGAVAGAAAFEWLRLAGHRDAVAVVAGVVFALLLLALHFTGLRPSGKLLAASSVFACMLWAGIASLLVAASQGGGRVSRGLSTTLCLVLLAAAWFAALELLSRSVVLLVSAMAIVWVADIAAYFFGRAFGKRKLAPRISPGKTWAGVGGAVFAVAALSVVFRMSWPQGDLLTNQLLASTSAPLALLALLALVALSIVGDLFESLLKRQAGVKDSSGLLPGHGGVLDRIDAVLPVLPAAILVTAWMH